MLDVIVVVRFGVLYVIIVVIMDLLSFGDFNMCGYLGVFLYRGCVISIVFFF